jgi:rod shape-determining protein MreB
MFKFGWGQDIGIDLGTATVIVYVKGQGIVLREPSVVAVDSNNGEVVAVGNEARRMLGRTPGNIVATRPLKDGVISDYTVTEKMLKYFIKKVGAKTLFSPRIMICIPSRVTEVEKKAVIDAATNAGARKVYLIEEPIAAAIGAGLDISKACGNMVVDIGGGTTDIAVLSMNNIVSSTSIRIAGNKLDEDIIKYIKSKHRILVGEKTAERIKIDFANIYKPSKKQKLEVKGRNVDTGLPDSIEITEEDTKNALKESVDKIIKAVKEVLEDTPPELSADIVEKGVILTGGGSLLTGLVEVLEEELTIPVLIAETPLTCVAEGTGILLNNIKLLEEDQ